MIKCLSCGAIYTTEEGRCGNCDINLSLSKVCQVARWDRDTPFGILLPQTFLLNDVLAKKEGANVNKRRFKKEIIG